MKKAHRRLLLVAFLMALAIGLLGYGLLGRGVVIGECLAVSRPPRIRPDYADTVIPPNIAPLRFRVDEPGTRYHVKVHAAHGEAIEIRSRGPKIAIPVAAWKRLLGENKGQQLHFDIRAREQDGTWRQYDTITNTIAAEEVDPYLVYRIINVLYNYYLRMKLCERSLQSYEESVILDNRTFGYGCINCHTFLNNTTEKMIVQMRSGHEDHGKGMLLVQDGVIRPVDARTQFNPAPAAFASWHPSGRTLAFSVNKVKQFFHSARAETREGIDLKSDLALYLPDTNTVMSTASISRPDVLETWPTWSPDGKYLYFCSAPLLWSDDAGMPPEGFDRVRYDLMRIGYDIDTGTWGELETVLSAENLELSISLPRISPDGRFLVFCTSRYGSFPALEPDSDLYLMNLATGEHRPMACNSDQSDSWHSWSSNGRWLAFSSKRGDGLFMKVYFTYIDDAGEASKPFVLPQKDPGFYDSFIRVYHLPEFARQPIPLRGEQIASVIRAGEWFQCSLPMTSPTPRTMPQAPQQDRPPGEAEPWRPYRE